MTLPHLRETIMFLNRSSNKSEDEFTQFFFMDGVPQFNNDRADVLNVPGSYGSQEEYILNATTFYNTGVPGVKNPRTGLEVNSRGQSSTFKLEGTEPQTSSLRSDDTNATNLREVTKLILPQHQRNFS